MKKLPFALLTALCLTPLPGSFAGITVIPRPLSVQENAAKTVPFNATYGIVCADPTLAATAARTIGFWTGLRLDAGNFPAKNGPAVTLDPASTDDAVRALGPAGYVLEVASGGAVSILANDAPGAFHGLQTLVQLFQNNGAGDWVLPIARIEDRPRFAWRGLMLDEGHRFLGKDAVKRLLDVMALHKLNTLHWRLADDGGWRIESKKFPRLTEVGAWRSESPLPGNRGQGDGRRSGGFYTQADIREIVAYATARHITVVPEIDVFGTGAALAAYPELGNTDLPGYAPRVATRWGLGSDTFAPEERTFQFLTDLLAELAPLFPAEYFHIGGHTVPLDPWQHSEKARRAMAKHQLGDPAAVRDWFVVRVEKILESQGKKLLGWDGIQNGAPPKNATLMVSSDWKWARPVLDRGNPVIMAPVSHCALDYGQGEAPAGPWYETLGGTLAIEQVYQFEPVPQGTPPRQEALILGCQALAWSEFFFDPAKAEYMLFPRALALAEVAWTDRERRDWADFSRRIPSGTARLDRLKVNYRRPDGTAARPVPTLQ